MTQPTVGRIVHYKSYGTPGGEYEPECRAAVVTEVPDDTARVGLAVLNPTGLFFNHAEHDAGQSGGTWHWPCVRTDGPEYIYRSAVDGKIVTEEYAQANPDTTVKERV